MAPIHAKLGLPPLSIWKSYLLQTLIHTCKYVCKYKIHNYTVCNTKYNYTQGVNGLTHLKNRAKMALVAIFISKAAGEDDAYNSIRVECRAMYV